MKPLSILLLGTQMATGGAQKLLLEQANWFKSYGHKVSVIYFYDRDGLHEKWNGAYPFEIQNLRAFDKKVKDIFNLPKLISGLWKLWQILKKEKFDAVITFTHDSNMLGLPIAWLARVPARVGTHLGKIRGMSVWREYLHTFLVNKNIIQILIASSKGARDNAIQVGVDSNKIRVVYNAITPFDVNTIDRNAIRAKLDLQKEDIFFVAIGRLVYEKGHEFLVEAMSIAARSNEKIVSGICGSGPLYESLTNQIKRLGLNEKVKLLGHWDNIPELLTAADVFVLPSRWEGLPMALLEGMMACLPVIATKVEGVEEVIEEGKHGLLTALESPAELAQAILQLSDTSKEDRERMGKAARERVLTSYTTNRMCEQYLQVIEQCLSVGETRRK